MQSIPGGREDATEPRGMSQTAPKYTPTKQQIADACRKIQSEWSPTEEQSRRVGRCRTQHVDYERVVRGMVDEPRGDE